MKQSEPWKQRTHVKIAPLHIEQPVIKTEWFEEPSLIFADAALHCDPKIGIPLYGPRSLGTMRHKREVHVGFIGTAEGIEQAQIFYADYTKGVDGDNEHAPFPGCTAASGYRCDLR